MGNFFTTDWKLTKKKGGEAIAFPPFLYPNSTGTIIITKTNNTTKFMKIVLHPSMGTPDVEVSINAPEVQGFPSFGLRTCPPPF